MPSSSPVRVAVALYFVGLAVLLGGLFLSVRERRFSWPWTGAGVGVVMVGVYLGARGDRDAG